MRRRLLRTTKAASSTTSTKTFATSFPSPTRRTMLSATQTLSYAAAAAAGINPAAMTVRPQPASAAAPPPKPAFTMRDATPEDAAAMSDVFFDAFQDDEITRRVFPAGSRRARAEMLHSFAGDVADPACHSLVAVDGAGHIVGLATWMAPGASWDRCSTPPPGDAAEFAGDEAGDEALGDEFFGIMAQKHAEHMGDRPHWTLGFIAVRRAWQGRGVARPLVAWGLERADADGLPAYIQSSPVAVPVYRRFGFEPIDEYRFRHAPDYVEVFMTRTPRQPDAGA